MSASVMRRCIGRGCRLALALLVSDRHEPIFSIWRIHAELNLCVILFYFTLYQARLGAIEDTES